MDDIVDYIASKNIEYKLEGQEIIITCPYCGKPKLYINRVSGKSHCFVCEAEQPNSPYAKTHISKLQELWGDVVPITSLSDQIEPNRNQQEVDYTLLVNRYHSSLQESKLAKRYLIKRGFTEETINRFKLGYIRMHDIDWISIPSFENHIPKLIKYRQIPPENTEFDKYIREKGAKSILFNGDVLDEYDEIIIVEGELSALSLIQEGYENTVGITGGAGTLLTPWFDKLKMISKLILIFDADSAGQTAAKDVWATRLGISRCWNVVLPENYDADQFLLEYGKEKLDKLINEAKQFRIDGVVSLKESLHELYRKSQDKDFIERYKLPWENVNKLLDGGFMKQRLTIIGAPAATGKTTIALQIMYHFATEYNIPGLFWCMEMPHISLSTKIVQLHYDLDYKEIDYGNAMMYAAELENLPLYFGYSSSITPKVFYNTMKVARDRFGVGLGVFDNLQRMIRTGKEADVAQASAVFKDIVMDLNMMFILISQPTKLSMEQEEGYLTYEVLKGSSAIPQDADEVILLQRKRIKNESSESALGPRTRIIVDKSRFSGGGTTVLNFIGEKSRFEEIPKCIKED